MTTYTIRNTSGQPVNPGTPMSIQSYNLARGCYDAVIADSQTLPARYADVVTVSGLNNGEIGPGDTSATSLPTLDTASLGVNGATVYLGANGRLLAAAPATGISQTLGTIGVVSALVGTVAFSISHDFSALANITIPGNLIRTEAVAATAGNGTVGQATALTSDVNAVTGADNTKAVKLPTAVAGMTVYVTNTDASHTLPVFPATGGAINALSANAAFTLAPGETAIFEATSTTQWYVRAQVSGIAAGYRIARGVHTQAAASDTVVTGLTTVVAVTATPQTRTLKQLFFNGSVGDQAGTPAAGSILITSQKPTAVNDVTPIAATDFTDSIVVDWIAVGT